MEEKSETDTTLDPRDPETSVDGNDADDPDAAVEAVLGEKETDRLSPELSAELQVEQELEAELSRLQAELDQMRDQHLRLAADFDNYRKRADGEMAGSWVRAQADLLRRILDALDDLQRVGDYDPETTTVEALHEGVALVERKIFKALADAGAEVLEPVGEVFNPATMEAVMSVPVDSEAADDLVAQVFQRGYMLKGHLVRPARVSVQQFE